MSISVEVNDGEAVLTAVAFDVSESAEMGQLDQGTITIDDPGGTIDLVSHKLVRIGEDDCVDEVLFRGFAGAEDDVRGTRKQEAGRTITLNTLDMNSKAGFKVIRGRAWRKRPVESVGDRLTDLLASDFVAVNDNGFVDYPDALVDGGDLRSMRPGDLLTDLAARVGFNWFIYWDEDETEASLWFKDSNASTEYTSTLRISNVLTDIDGLTTFEASGDTAFRRDPVNLVSGVWMPFKKGNVYRTRSETEDIYEPRDGTAPSSRTKRRARARNIADRYLFQHRNPEDRITTTVLLPSSRVNLIKAGHRIQARFSHLATQGYSEWTWFRVLHRKTSWLLSRGGRPELPGEPLYPVQLVLSPQEGAGDTPGAAPSVVQHKHVETASNTQITLDNNVTIGHLLIAIGIKDGTADPTMTGGEWIKIGQAYAADVPGTGGAGVAFAFYRVANATEPTYGRGATADHYQWHLYELANCGPDDIHSLVLEEQDPAGNLSTFDLGTFTATNGVVLMAQVETRDTNQQDIEGVFSRDGWEFRFNDELQESGEPPTCAVGDIFVATGDVEAAWEFEETVLAQDIGHWGGVAVYVGP